MHEITEPDTSTLSWNARNPERIRVTSRDGHVRVIIAIGAHGLDLALYGDTAARLHELLGDELAAQDNAGRQHRDVQAALDRIAAWAPDTARRVRSALAGGVPQAAVVAWEMLAAVVVSSDLEADRSTVLDALGALADGTPAVQS